MVMQSDADEGRPQTNRRIILRTIIDYRYPNKWPDAGQ